MDKELAEMVEENGIVYHLSEFRGKKFSQPGYNSKISDRRRKKSKNQDRQAE